MKKIFEINEEILVLYNILGNNTYMNKYKKEKILKKIEELVYKENYLFSILDINRDLYDNYMNQIEMYKNSEISARLKKYLIYLYSKEKIFLPGLIYFDYAYKGLKYYKFFDLEKELNKIIIKNTSNLRKKYEILYSDKLLELDYINDGFKFKEKNLNNNLTKREIQLFKISKKAYVEDQLYNFIKDNTKDSYIIIKSLLEFDKDNFEEYYKNIIEILNKLQNKCKLDNFINKFGNRKK